MDEPVQIQQRLLTPREAAKYLSISERTLLTLATKGRIPAVKMGRRCVRYDIADIDNFILKAKGSQHNREYETGWKAGAVG